MPQTPPDPSRNHRKKARGRSSKKNRPVAAGSAPSPATLKSGSDTRRQRHSLRALGTRCHRDVIGFGFRRSLAIGRLVVVEAMRMRIWGVILIGLLAIIVGDLTTRHFDPIQDLLPNLVNTSEVTLTVLGIIVALFLSTYSLPHEITTRTIYSLVTKPVSRLELLAGKFMGMVMVLALLTLGLGLPTWIYMQIRSAQVQQMATERLELVRGDRLPSDLEPLTLQSIADRGPLAARVFLDPQDALQIVSTIDSERRVWLSGARNHIAHWGFEGLPVEALAAGNGRVRFKVAFMDPAAAQALEKREVLVRIVNQGLREAEQSAWSGSRVLSVDGTLELEIPGVAQQLQSGVQQPLVYTGGKLWISLAGVNAPQLTVEDGSAVVVVDGREYASGSGLRTTTSQTMGKFWLTSGQRFEGLKSRTRFKDIPADLSASGTQLQVEVTVPSASDIARDARAVLTLLNPLRPELKRQMTFRPERRTSLLVDVPPELMQGGALDVFVSTDDPNVEVGVNEQSVRMIRAWRPLAWNWLKDLTMSWLSFCAVASIGLMFSTISGWYVASLASAVMVVVAYVWRSILENVQRYGLSFSTEHHHGPETEGPSWIMQILERLHETLFELLGSLLPNLSQMDYGDLVARGVNAPAAWLFAMPYGVFWQVLVYVLVMLALSYLLFVRKEVAQQ